MKKYLILFSICFVFTLIDVKALTYQEIETRNVCDNFELALANGDKSITTVGCFDDYESVKNEFLNTDNDDLIILERSNNKTVIIDAKLALVYLGVKTSDKNTNYYQDKYLKNYLTYMNHYPSYGASDGVFLEFDYETHSAKVKTNGIIGWVGRDEYKIIPLNFTGSFSYYEVTKDEIYHYYSKDIQTWYTQFKRAIDKKPSMLEVGQYFSYDGKYFYKKVVDMIKDYMNNTYENSFNKDNPYYNYYMYLPHRGISNYSADDIDAYLKNSKSLIGTIYGKKYVYGYSNMYQAGIYFKATESLYGANALLMYSLAVNESSLGQSNIAVNKNNLFGHSAYDSSAFDSATGYLNPYQSIVGQAKTYINCGYANPKDSRYYGSHVGNKLTGMNVKYASDPLWGEKVANNYYLFDKDNGFLDYNYYQLGVTNTTSINVRVEPNTKSQIPFSLKYIDVPVIILEEVEGETYNDSNIWYKIVSDANLTNDRTTIPSCTYTSYYNYDSYVYVHSSLINKINDTSYKSNKIETDKNYTYHEYSSGAIYTPLVGLIKKDTLIYDTATLSVTNNKKLAKGNLTPVFMEAKDEKGEVVAYQVMSDYSKNQKGWVNASDLSFSEKDLVKVSLTKSGDFLNVYNAPTGSVLGSIYTDTFSVIVDKKTYNDALWLKIYYGNNTFAWLNTSIEDDKGSISYTLDKINQIPSINASDKTIYILDEFDPKIDVTAYDAEDGDITNNITIESNVNTDKPGEYQVTYKVSDSRGESVTKTIKIKVLDYKLGNSLFIYESLKHIENNKFLFKGFLGIKGQDNINNNHYLVFINENTNKSYRFKLDNYIDYPYDMSSLDDDKNYNYKDGWFKGVIDLNKGSIPNGDYKIYIESYNLDSKYMTKTYFTNIAYLDMERRVKTSDRGFSFDVDYSTLNSPILMTIRDNHLLSYDAPSSLDPMYNFFNELVINNNTLSITGTSHSIGSSYSKTDNIERSIIFENINTFERFIYNLGYIDNGPYKVELSVTDNLDKTRAWFKNNVDLDKLSKGTYAIYIKTTSNNKTYYGELIDIAYTDFKNINTEKYKFQRNDLKRLRLELIVN